MNSNKIKTMKQQDVLANNVTQLKINSVPTIIHPSTIVYTPSGTSVILDTIIDSPNALQLFPHPLYNLLAVLSNYSLLIISIPHLTIVQVLFDPLAIPWDIRETHHPKSNFSDLPIRLQDASIAFPFNNIVSTGTHLSTDLPTASICTDRLLCASWHRDSLTVVVGSVRALFIFKGIRCKFLQLKSDSDVTNQQAIEFQCVFHSPMTWPCYSVFWLGDHLLTKSTYAPSADNRKLLSNKGSTKFDKSGFDTKHYNDYKSELSSVQFFFWRCEFSRYTVPIQLMEPYPLFFEATDAALNYPSVSALQESISGSCPILRDYWSITSKPLAEFITCAHAPSFSWKPVAGCNARPLPIVPILQPKYYSATIHTTNEDRFNSDRFTVDVRKIVSHPSSRFLAVLYIVSARSTDTSGSPIKKKIKEQQRHIPLKQNIISVPSPIVRVWSLRPNPDRFSKYDAKQSHSDSDDDAELCYKDENGRLGERNPASSNKKKRQKRKFISIGHVKEGITKGSSCFLSGVSGLFHLRHHYRSKKQSLPKEDIDYTDDLGALVTATELQGPEWLMLKQLTTVTETPGLWRGASVLGISRSNSVIGQKVSLLALMASRGLVSDNDSATYHSTRTSLQSLGTSSAQADTGCRRLETSLESTYGNAQLRSDEQYIMGDTFVPALLDGPYISTSLSHKAPVLDVLWKDDGPMTDGIFIPAVITTLTLDYCLTVWVESSSDTYLWFEAVILLRLDVTPLNHFFRPLDFLPDLKETTDNSNEQIYQQDKESHYKLEDQSKKQQQLYDSNIVRPPFWCDLRSFTSPFDHTPAITMCWLTTHRVSFQTEDIDNLLRLNQIEIKSQYLDLELLDWSSKRTKPYPHQSVSSHPSQPDKGLSSFVSRKGSAFFSRRASGVTNPTHTSDITGYLSLRPGAHLCEAGHTVLQDRNDKNRSQSPKRISGSTTCIPTLVAPIDSTASISCGLPLASLTHSRQTIDFLIVAETCYEGQENSQSGVSGFWVYTFKELASQPRGSPAVKLLLEPRHLPFPCRIQSLVSVESLRSLGLSDVVWGDGTAPMHGIPIIVTDGILFPACMITVISISGDIWNCFVRPYIFPAHQTTGFSGGRIIDGLKIHYEVLFQNVFGFSRSSFHTFQPRMNTLNDIFGIYPQHNASPKSKQLYSGDLPLSVSKSVYYRTTKSRRQLTNYSSHNELNEGYQLHQTYWKYLEEHPQIPHLLLAIDSRGWVSLGLLYLQPIEDNICDPLESLESIGSPLYSSAYGSGLLDHHTISSQDTMFGINGQYTRKTKPDISTYHRTLSLSKDTHLISNQTYKDQHNILGTIHADKMTCIHSITGHWIDSSVTLQTDTIPYGNNHRGSESDIIDSSLIKSNTVKQQEPIDHLHYLTKIHIPLPIFRHAVWLPFATHPPILLAVTEPQGQLLALEIVYNTPGQPPKYRGLPFSGTYCESLLSTQLLLPNDSKIQTTTHSPSPMETEGYLPHSVIEDIQVQFYDEMECVIIIRIALELTKQDHVVDDDLLDDRLLREQHILVLRCSEMIRTPTNDFSDDICETRHLNIEKDTPLIERTGLLLDLVFDGFLDFNPLFISLNHPDIHSTKDRRLITQVDTNRQKIQSTPSITFIEFTPQIAFCGNFSGTDILGILACHPPLDLNHDVDITPSDDHLNDIIDKTHDNNFNPKRNRSVVGIYDITITGSIRLLGYAAVLTQQGCYIKQHSINDVIVGMAINEEWLATLTEHGVLSFFSITNMTPFPTISSFPQLIMAANCTIFTTPLPTHIIPPLSYLPVITFSFKKNITHLQVESNTKYKEIEQYIDSLHPRHQSNSSASGQSSFTGPKPEDGSKYFTERRPLLDGQLKNDLGHFHPRSHLSGIKRMTTTTSHLSIDSSQVPSVNKTYSDYTLKPQMLGDPPYLSFRQSKGDGLSLLVALRCDPVASPTRTSNRLRLDIGPHTESVLLIRTRKNGVCSWTNPNQKLFPSVSPFLISTVSWAASPDCLLISPSHVPYCMNESILPPSIKPIPAYIRVLTSTAGSPRPIFHPESLKALLCRSNDILLILRILKRLQVSLSAWRQSGTGISPTLSFSIDAFTSSSSSWIHHEFRHSSLKNTIIEKLHSFDHFFPLPQLDLNVSENLPLALNHSQHSRDSFTESNFLSIVPPTTQTITNLTPIASTIKPVGTFQPTIPASGRAAELFNNDSDSAIDPFSLNFSSDDDVEDDNTPSNSKQPTTPPRLRVNRIDEFEESCMHKASLPTVTIKETIHVARSKSSNNNTNASVSDSQLPLTDIANAADLKELSLLLDIRDPKTFESLGAYPVIVPYLTLIESTELLSFVQMISRIYTFTQSTSLEPAIRLPFENIPCFNLLAKCYSILDGGDVSIGSENSPASRFIFAYTEMLSRIAARESLLQFIRTLPIGQIKNETDTDITKLKDMPQTATFTERMADDTNLEHVSYSVVHLMQILEEEFRLTHYVSTKDDRHEPDSNLIYLTEYAYSTTTCDICWAVHCEADDVLLQNVLSVWRNLTPVPDGSKRIYLSWSVLRQAGVGFWLRNPIIATQLASNELPKDIYSAQPTEQKNPDSVALWYIATGRIAVLKALYQSVKNSKVVEFLSHDFNEPRWRAAASKNAYALVKQKRYELAVSFFILARSYSEAIEVCCGQLDDPQLALFLSLILEHCFSNEQEPHIVSVSTDSSNLIDVPNESPTGLRKNILEHKVLPYSIQVHDIWLQSLTLWLLERYEQALICTLPDDVKPFRGCGGLNAPRIFGKEDDLKTGMSQASEPLSYENAAIPVEKHDKLLLDEIYTISLKDYYRTQATMVLSTIEADSVEEKNKSHTCPLLFGSESVRLSPRNPSIRALRRHMLHTLQLRRAVMTDTVVKEILTVLKQAKAYNKTISDSKNKNEPLGLECFAGVTLTAGALAGIITLSTNYINLLDIGDALLYSLDNRFPFQSVQYSNDLHIMKSIMLFHTVNNYSGNEPSQHIGWDPQIHSFIRQLRWTYAIGMTRHFCDLLGHSTGIKPQEALTDIMWLDMLLDDNLENLTRKDFHACRTVASGAWKRIISSMAWGSRFGSEHYLHWIEKDIQFTQHDICHDVSSTSEVEQDQSKTDPAIRLKKDALQYPLIHAYIEHLQHHSLFTDCLFSKILGLVIRNVPRLNMLNEQFPWFEAILFKTIINGVLNLMSNMSLLYSRKQHERNGYLSQLVLAEAVTLNGIIRTALSHISHGGFLFHLNALLLSMCLITSSCVASAGSYLLLSYLTKAALQTHRHCKDDKLNPQGYDPTTFHHCLHHNNNKNEFDSHHDGVFNDMQIDILPECFFNCNIEILWAGFYRFLLHLETLDASLTELGRNLSLGRHIEEQEKFVSCLHSITSEVIYFQNSFLHLILLPHPGTIQTFINQDSTHNTTDCTQIQTSKCGALPGNGKHTTAPLPVGSEALQTLLTAKSEAATQMTAGALADEDDCSNRRRHMWILLLSIIESSLHDRLISHMNITSFTAETLYRLSCTNESAESWCPSVSHMLLGFKWFAASYRTIFHGDHLVEVYTRLITKVAVEFPFLPMALATPLAFPKDPTALTDESIELAYVDTTCSLFAQKACGGTIIEMSYFKKVWSTLHCSRRLQFLLARGPILGMPRCLGVGTLTPAQLPVYCRVIACLREPPISIAIDKTYGMPQMHHFSCLGSSINSCQPMGLNIDSGNCGEVGRPGLGILSVSTGKGVWETNMVHSVMFHRLFSSAAATGNANLTAAIASAIANPDPSKTTNVAVPPNTLASSGQDIVGNSINTDISEKHHTTSHNKPGSHHFLSHQFNLLHLPTSSNIIMHYDDEDSSHTFRTTHGRLRVYDLAAEIYERQVADQASHIFGCTQHTLSCGEDFLHRGKSSDMPTGGANYNDIVQKKKDNDTQNNTANEGMIKKVGSGHKELIETSPEVTEHLDGSASEVKQSTLIRSQSTDNKTLQSGGRLSKKLHRVRPHWHLPQSSNSKTPLIYQKLLRVHLTSPSKNSSTGNSLGTSTYELPLYHFNLLLELLLRGVLNPLGDAAVTRLDTVPSNWTTGTSIGSPTRLSLLDSEASLLISGLSLFPLPHSPQKSLIPSINGNGQNNTKLSNFKYSLGLSIPNRCASSWVKYTSLLQQRFTRNHLVELQLSCLPPLPTSSSASSSQPHHDVAMALLRPHPWLPICAGAIADSQIVHSPQGTLVISLWKIGSPNIKAIGSLALSASLRGGSAVVPSNSQQIDTGKPGSAPAGPTIKHDLSGKLPNLAKRGVAGGLSSHSPSGMMIGNGELGDYPILTYSEAGPIKSLEWSMNGARLVAGHTKGWVSIWQLRSDRFPILSPSGHQKDNIVQLDGKDTNIPLTNTSPNHHRSLLPSLGLPYAVFRPHTTSCRFATFLSSGYSADSSLLITSGRGLAATSVMFSSNHRGNSSVTAGAEEGAVCIWDINGGDSLGPPQLLMVDTSFEKGNYATDVVVWAARQCVLYSGRRGEVKLMNLRRPGVCHWVVHPFTAQIRRTQKKQMRLQQQNQSGGSAGIPNDFDHPSPLIDTGTTPSAGPFGKEIVKLFLLEETQRLVTCYEDSMIRVWDLSDFCSSQFSRTGIIAKNVRQPNITPSLKGNRLVHYRDMEETANVSTSVSQEQRFYAVPLLWETPSPVHGHDTSKLSLVASVLGAVFNIAPGGSPRTLLDAQMASPNHVVTLGADGSIVLTRI